MTSEERHEARYQRRKAARERKRREYLDQFDDFNRAARPSALINAHFDSRRGVLWKYSPALYESSYIKYSAKSSQRLYKGQNVCQGFYRFGVQERGKHRDVHSVHYTERVIRRSFCINCFVPILSHDLIYDNGASLKGKGGGFTEERTAAHFHEFFRENGTNDGYAVVVDFKSYFANIPHDGLFAYTSKRIRDPRLMETHRRFVKASDADKPPEEQGKGLYIGPEDSQILAISYPNDIDHCIKDKMRKKHYVRYNDDSFILCRTKEEAQSTLAALLVMYESKGIIPNPKKTQIIKLSRGIPFLKVKFYLQDNGRLVRKPDHDCIVRERRKLKKFRNFMDNGEMTMAQACQSYMSWRGHIRKWRNSGRSVRNMDELFLTLFHAKPWKKKQKSQGGQHHGKP